MSQNEEFKKRLERLQQGPRVGINSNPNRTGLYDFEEEKRRKRGGFRWRRMFIAGFVLWSTMFFLKMYIIHTMDESDYQARLVEIKNDDDPLAPFLYFLAERGPLQQYLEDVFFEGGGDAKKAASDAELL